MTPGSTKSLYVLMVPAPSNCMLGGVVSLTSTNLVSVLAAFPDVSLTSKNK